MSDKLHIAVACNRKYLPGAEMAIAGDAANAKSETNLVFHLFTEGLTDEDVRPVREWLMRLHGKSELVHHPCDESLLGELPAWAGSRLASVRCVFPEILKDIDWCLYLDCDILYLASVEEHFSFRNEKVYACVVQDESAQSRELAIRWSEENCKVSIPDEKYFNSGVMLFNLAKMRRDGTARKLVDFFARHPSPPFSDQDVLNAVFDSNIVMLPQRFNRLQIFIDDEKLRERPVVHYVCGNPWTKNLGCVANNRFRLWHACADKWIWRKSGESVRRCFPWRIRAGKAICLALLRIPVVGALFAWTLEKAHLINVARDWRWKQTKCDVSRGAIEEALS